jgi:molybdopterin synthase catalytic subunit
MKAEIRAAIRSERLDAAAIEASVEKPGAGGICVFKGNIRPQEGDRTIGSMTYAHYEGMAQKVLRQIADDAAARWPLLAIAVEHRVGEIPVGESAVIVAVGAGHRAEAFEACRHIIETIKQKLPVWKASDAGPGKSEAVPEEEEESGTIFGCMEGTIKIKGDIMQPIPEEDWWSGGDNLDKGVQQ